MTNNDSDPPDFTPVTRVELKRADIGEMVMSDELLRSAPVVRAMGEGAKALIKAGLGRRYPDKVPVFRQAETGDSLFLVLKGEARLFAVSGEDTVEVGSAGKGEVFGEDEILNGKGVRSLSAIAAGELHAVELPYRAVFDCGRERPNLNLYLKELHARRRAARDEIAAFLDRW